MTLESSDCLPNEIHVLVFRDNNCSYELIYKDTIWRNSLIDQNSIFISTLDNE